MNANNCDIVLLTDYRGAFWSTIRNRWGICSLDVDVLRQTFEERGYVLQVLPFSEVDLRTHDFRGKFVLYQSAEDRNSYYKDYLEDVLLGIQMQGGQLVPPFHCFRAHHNKVFMEILRAVSGDPRILRPRARTWGTLEDFRSATIDCPLVVKQFWGAASTGVTLVRSRKEAVRAAARTSWSAGIVDALKEHVKRWLRRKKGYVPSSLHRRKFVTQEFLPDLQGDFKVLVYWDRYYVVYRKNRPGDFRASGSGLFSWPEMPPAGLLDFARHVFNHFRVPMISLDVGMTAEGPVLIEFQCVSFGPIAMERSEWYFQQQQGEWVRTPARSVPETEFVRSVCCYLEEERTKAGS
jgi:glutathione synthase/RimK-type ligase-like ATP-grasp enzyme